MVKFYPSLPDNLKEWALDQPLFFTASAPTYGKHVNVSPKGLPSATLHVFGPNKAAYVDASGSGVETISHIYENGRVTIMFASFKESPMIMRWFCRGRVIEWDRPEFVKLTKQMDKGMVGARAVIMLDIWKVQTSCGFGVPLLSPTSKAEPDIKLTASDRRTLSSTAERMVASNKMFKAQVEYNKNSLDGLPGLKSARRGNHQSLAAGDAQAWAHRLLKQKQGMLVGWLLGMVCTVVLVVLMEHYASDARFGLRWIR